ncbi:MAG TPA: SDR family oxidoreductase [Nevskiales bacterium]|nr:SDR family oxidoreductase [Nevskiales bacterium]
MGRVANKVAIVTGAASGVGKADAMVLAREGAKVVLTDLNEKDGAAAARQINDKYGDGSALFIRHDIASEDDWKTVIAKTEEAFGGLDVLVNNAAILLYGTIEDTDLATWQKIQRINGDGYFLGCHYGYAAMRRRGGGSIINMSSISGIRGVSSFCAYSASKGAVAALTRSIAAHSRMNLHKIRCNSIHPDGIMTPMVANLQGSMPKGKQTQVRMMDQKQMMARFATPEQIADLVLFLASDESSFINGAEMRIDNGYSMWGD